MCSNIVSRCNIFHWIIPDRLGYRWIVEFELSFHIFVSERGSKISLAFMLSGQSVKKESLRFKLNGNGTNLTRDGNDNYQNTSDDPAIKGRVKVWRQKSLTKYEKIVDWANSQFSCVTRDLNSKYTARHLDYQTWMCLTSPVDWSPQLQKRYQKRSFKNSLDQFLRFLQISTFWNLYFFLYTFRFCLYF